MSRVTVTIAKGPEPEKEYSHSVMLDGGIGYVLREDGQLTLYGTPLQVAELLIDRSSRNSIFIAQNLLEINMAAKTMKWLNKNPPTEFRELQKAFYRLIKLLPFS